MSPVYLLPMSPVHTRPRYKAHRAVDDDYGVITATRTTPGDKTENTQVKELIEQHLDHTAIQPNCVVGDKQYGTVDNFRQLQRMGITTHMAEYAKGKSKKLPLYGNECFSYDPASDTYSCPAGKQLYPRRYDKPHHAMEYKARKNDCLQCPLRGQCTTAVNGRTLLRHDGQELIDQGVIQCKTPPAYLRRRRRKWRVEGSFGQATRHHFKRSRDRRLWRQRIQDWIICAVQNIKIIIQHETPLKKADDAVLVQTTNYLAYKIRSLTSFATLHAKMKHYRSHTVGRLTLPLIRSINLKPQN